MSENRLSQKHQPRSVSRMRSTLLLKRSINRNQKFITLHEEQRACDSLSSTSDDEESDESEDELSPRMQPSSLLPQNSQEQVYDTDYWGGSHKQQPTMEKNTQEVLGKVHEDQCDSDSDKESVVDAVLAFQRWRQLNLKRLFSQELKKVLEEARRDEASLTTMQRELMKRDENLVRAQAESVHLRAHISAIESAVQSQNNRNYNEHAQREVYKAQERAYAAEEEVIRRDKEIIRLKQWVKCLESEKGRVDNNLQASLALLQHDKAGVRKENRALLDQLARKDHEIVLQNERADKLQARIASMTAFHNEMKSDHEAHITTLQNQIKQEQDAKSTLEKDMEVLRRRCDSLEKEKECINLQLDKTLDKLTSHDNTQWCSEGHAKTSEAIAAGILEHLKILTGHMMKLEASFGRNTRAPGLYSSLHKIDVNLELALRSFRQSSINSRLQLMEYCPEPRSSCLLLNQTVQTESELRESLDEDGYISVRDARTQTSFLYNHDTVTQTSRWIAWKWRWICAAQKAKVLAKQLRYSRSLGGKVNTKSKNGYGSIQTTMERELKAAIPGNNIVPILLSLWRAYRRSPKSERKVFSKDVLLDKVLTTFPWWIRRVSEKRRLERAFYRWLYITSSSTKKQSYQTESFYFHPHSCYNRPSADEYHSVRRKISKVSKYHDNSSDGNAPPQQGIVVRKQVEPERGLDLVKAERRPRMLTSSGYATGGSTFTARALRTLQVSLQQEFQDLQQLLAKEVEAVQSQVGVRQFDNEKSTQRRRMTFLWEVCNSLANALMDAHKQLVSLDREFNLRVCNYLELSQASCDPKQARPRSPRGAGLDNNKINAGCVGGLARRRMKHNCIASRCAAILQSEFRKYSHEKFDTEDVLLSPRLNVKRPPWTR